MVDWDGDAYQRRFDDLAASGADVHGEADFVMAFEPGSVLDAGCGTGRVAVELARRGVEVHGVDVDASMIATARRQDPDVTWTEDDLVDLDLGRRFDVVVLAGNVALFAQPGTHQRLVARCAAHLSPGGHLVAGFSIHGPGGTARPTPSTVTAAEWDGWCHAAGLVAEDRWSTWDRQAFDDGRSDYVVAVHRRPITV